MDSHWANFREILCGGFALRRTDIQIHAWLKSVKNNRNLKCSTARAGDAGIYRRTQNTQLLFSWIPPRLRLNCKKHVRASEAVDNMTSHTLFACRHARYAIYDCFVHTRKRVVVRRGGNWELCSDWLVITVCWATQYTICWATQHTICWATQYSVCWATQCTAESHSTLYDKPHITLSTEAHSTPSVEPPSTLHAEPQSTLSVEPHSTTWRAMSISFCGCCYFF